MAPEPIQLGSGEKRGLREPNHLWQSNKAQIESSQTGVQEQTQDRGREAFDHKNRSLLQAVRDQPVIRGAAELVEEAPSEQARIAQESSVASSDLAFALGPRPIKPGSDLTRQAPGHQEW